AENKKQRDYYEKIWTNLVLPIIEPNELQTDYITTEDDWNEKLTEWHEMLAQEEKNENNILDSGKFDDSFFSSQTHPAIDINAKWDLRDLFIRELEKPEFISISLN
ncbi:23847_t:CDS:2, partial [Gigaspora margarita]